MRDPATKAFCLEATASPVAGGPGPVRVKRIVLVDASRLYAEAWRAVFAARYGTSVTFEAYADPLEALPRLGEDVSLLMVDLELPLFGGRKVLELAKQRGVSGRRIVILSERPAEDLHALFPQEACLAVINKSEPQQQNAFLMILDSIVRRH
jgi:CheY-like chemotaxis protein